MAANLWRGSISFGLINIPVSVQTAVQDHDLHFNMLDERNLSRIKFKRVNEKTGQEVPYSHIVKGYEFKKGKYIILTDKDFKDANPKASQMLEIETFVHQDDIDPMYFEKPYFLVPEKDAPKAKPAELQMAQRLIDDMTGKWDPSKYKDTYYADLKKQIQKRITAGKGKTIPRTAEKSSKVFNLEATPAGDLMDLLKASMRQPKAKASASKTKSRQVH